MKSPRYPIHPLCSLFPPLGGAEYDELRDDIAANGLRDPIVLLDEQILDGQNRYRACNELGREATFINYLGDDPAGFVISKNVKRRHLTEGQRAALMAMALNWRGLQRRVASSVAKLADALGADDEKCKLAPQDVVSAPSQAERAQKAGVSIRQQKMADKVAKEAPELIKDVAAGKVTLPEAVEEVTGKRPGKRPPRIASPSQLEKRLAELGDEVIDLQEKVATLTAQRDQLADDNKAMIKELEQLDKIMSADDKLKAAVGEIKQLHKTIQQLESRIHGLMGEKNAAIQAAKSAQRKAATDKKAKQ